MAIFSSSSFCCGIGEHNSTFKIKIPKRNDLRFCSRCQILFSWSLFVNERISFIDWHDLYLCINEKSCKQKEKKTAEVRQLQIDEKLLIVMRLDWTFFLLLIELSFDFVRTTDEEPVKAHVGTSSWYVETMTTSFFLLRLAIIGAGLGGLSTAYWLKHYLNDSIAITIYENDQVEREKIFETKRNETSI